jgi:transcriptional regulator with XRE-family HTH domain
VQDPAASPVARRDAKPPRSAALQFARELCGVDREELAARTGFKRSTIEYLERGKGEPGQASLEGLMAGLGVSPATLEDLLALAEEIRGQPVQDLWLGPMRLSGTRLRRAREFGRAMGNLEGRNFQDYILRTWSEEQAAKDRETASQIGYSLRGKENLVEFVRGDAGCHLWSVAEWLCTESINVVAKDHDRAAALAEAALAVAELAPSEERFRARLVGYCCGHIGNILRVKNEFEESDATFARCSALWGAGAVGDPYGLLDAGRLMGMEASLRREQGRFTEALRLLREALLIASKDIQPYLRLNCGFVLEQLGDSEGAIRVLKEAEIGGLRAKMLAPRRRVVEAGIEQAGAKSARLVERALRLALDDLRRIGEREDAINPDLQFAEDLKEIQATQPLLGDGLWLAAWESPGPQPAPDNSFEGWMVPAPTVMYLLGSSRCWRRWSPDAERLSSRVRDDRSRIDSRRSAFKEVAAGIFVEDAL